MPATVSSAPIVDGHAHVWALDPDAYPWQPTFGYVPTEPAPPDALLAVMDRLGVTHAILVQPSVYGSDHRFLLDTVRDHPDRFLAIGLVDPADMTVDVTPASLVSDGGCVGLRVNLSLNPRRAASQADESRWAELEGVGVPICVRATPAHHDLVKGLLSRHPRLRLVVDHLGLPDPGSPAPTIARLTELARFEHCWLKIADLRRLSSMTVPHRDVWWVVRAALRLFGSSRLLWGSDFPNADADGGYSAAVRTIESMPFLDAADRDRLMAGTSRELWGFPPKRSTP
jgi:predicted TIM-barrel fold metal-dependent hydrolase